MNYLKHLLRVQAVIVGLIVLSLSAYSNTIQTVNGNIELPTGIDQKSLEDLTAFNGQAYGLLQFDRIPTLTEQNEMVEMGITAMAYVPNNTYLVSISSSANPGILTDLGAKALTSVPLELKMSSNLFNREIPQHALRSNDKVMVIVELYDNVKPAAAWAECNKLNWVDYSEDYRLGGLEHVVVSIDDLDKLAKLPFVMFIEEEMAPAEPENYTAKTLTRSNVLDASYESGYHYDGDGVTVVLQDDGIIGPHIDYTGRITQYTSSNGGNHGDHCGGIITGAGNLNPLTEGQAPGADMLVYDVYDAIDDMFNIYTNLEGVITSTSYGNGCNAGYTAFSREHDEQVNQMPALMHVFSTGNSGNSNCGYGAGSGWGNITGGHKIGKNVISVGNLDANSNLANSSSRGPSADGRIKPDICAKGSSVVSTIDVNTYATFSGTSMACPGVSGSLAQVYQAYEEITGNPVPPSDLMKGLLLNTADDLGNPGPDFKFGWGEVNQRRALIVLQNGQYELDSLSQGNSNQHTITVPANVAQLKVMVYWHDVEALAGVSKALVNDLNITLTTPGSVDYDPWVLDPAPNATTLDLPAVRGVDTLNNMEQVTLDNPATGTYTLDVDGFNIPLGMQAYYLIYDFVYDEVVVTYPNGGEGLDPGDVEKIRWDAGSSASTFAIEYSSNNGGSWTNVVSGVNGTQRYYDWTVPNGITADGLIRVSNGSQSGTSPSTFSILSTPGGLNVPSACPGGFDLSWNAVPGADAYDVFLLGDKYMDSIGTTSSTTFTIDCASPSLTDWVTVRARTNGGAVSQKATSIDKPTGVFNCNVGNDLEVSLVASPGEEHIEDCVGSDTIDVTIRIGNFANNAQSGFQVGYQLNGGSIITETHSGNVIGNGGTSDYTFQTPITSGTIYGFNELVVWVFTGVDATTCNDTLVFGFEVEAATIATLPYSEDFESFSPCGTNSDCEQTICETFNGWVNESNGVNDDIDWRTDFGGTPSTGTGPDIDHNPGTASGNYLYLEASNGCNGEVAHLVSPCIDLTGTTSPNMEFWYHMSGGSIGDLHVDVFDGSNWILDVRPVISGNQGQNWLSAGVDLTAYAGTFINVRFRGITGNNFDSDMAIDDINIIELAAAPVADFEADELNPCVGVTEVTFTDLTQNIPSNWQWTFNPNTVTFLNGTNANSQSPVVTFDAQGTYEVTLVSTNGIGTDTEVKTAYITTDPGMTLPYNEDFESFSLCGTGSDCDQTVCPLINNWTNELNNIEDDIDWRVHEGATPSNQFGGTGPVTDFNPGTNTGNYVYIEPSNGCNGEEAVMISPCINLTGATNPGLIFAYNMWGVAQGELHIDMYQGGSWQNDIYTLTGDQGEGWKTDSIDLSAYIGSTVTFRFRGITGTGWQSDLALDDISVREMINQAPVAGFNFTAPLCVGQPVTFTDASTGNGITALAWDFGLGATPQNAVGAGPHNVVFSTAGTQNVSLTATNSGGSDMASQMLNIDDVPSSNFVYSGSGNTITFNNLSTNSNSTFWDFGDGFGTSVFSAPTYSYASGGSYDVVLVSTNDCGSDTLKKAVLVYPDGLEELPQGYLVSVYPNPNQGQFAVNFEGFANEELEVQVTDALGRTVFAKEVVLTQNKEQVSIRLTDVASGWYQISVITSEFRYSQPLNIIE